MQKEGVSDVKQSAIPRSGPSRASKTGSPRGTVGIPDCQKADCQKNDILALVAKPCRLHVDAPGIGAARGDAIDQW
jgi:hypothetical protein